MYIEETPRKGKKRLNKRVFCEGKPEKGEHDWEDGVEPKYARNVWEDLPKSTQDHYIQLHGKANAPREWLKLAAERKNYFGVRWIYRRCRKCGRTGFTVKPKNEGEEA